MTLGDQNCSVANQNGKWRKICQVAFGKLNVDALLDTGADVSLVSTNLFQKIPRLNRSKIRAPAPGYRLLSVTGQDLEVLGKSTLKFKIGKKQLSFEFTVISHMKNSVILGSDFLSAFNVRWDFSKRTISLGTMIVPLKDKRESESIELVRCAQSVHVPPLSTVVVPCTLPKKTKGEYIIIPLDNSTLFHDQPGLLAPNVLVNSNSSALIIKNDTQRLFHVRKNQVIALAESVNTSSCEYINNVEMQKSSEIPCKVDLNNVPENFRAEFEHLINEYSDLFAESDLDLGRTNQVKMTIDTGDHTPIKQKPYRTPFSERPKIEKTLDDMLKADIIRPSTSPWASPIVIVPKKDGSKRMCVDYRKVNQITHKNSYPLPNISEILSSFKDAKVFSCLDLKSGYWQIEVEEKDREKTAFTCHAGLFEFNVLPFGLTAAPPVFQNLMDGILNGTLGRFTCVYLDDIIIYSSSIEEHLTHLRIVFDRLRQANLKLKPSKCDFAVKEVNFLGHRVSSDGVQPDPAKISVIKNLKPPTTVREVRSFIGMASYYRRFIDHFSDIAGPLTQLTRKYAKFMWNEECQNAFDRLKTALCEAPILAHPDLSKPYKLYTDASLKAVGAVLTQEFPEGERVIQYVSKQLSTGQQKWATIEREAYAIVYAVNKLRQYLLGMKFTVYTDHKPLRSLFTAEMRNARIQRWAIMLSEYGCDIEYQSGKLNVPADVLSRLASGDAAEEVLILDSSEPVETPAATSEENDDFHEPEHHTLDQNDPLLTFATDLMQDQRKDDFLSPLIENIEEGNEMNDYILDEGILYHISTPVKRDSAPCLQVAIPLKHVSSLLHYLHDSEYGGGHGGVEKTYNKIRRRYHWPNMYRDVANHVNKCDLCKARRLKRGHAPMQDMPIPSFPFEIVGIDTCGPFPETANGNKYVITLIDHLSAWPEAFAVKDKGAETVANVLLHEIIPRHSCPRILLSDRGTEFVNAVISILTEKLRVVHLKSSPYHPETNGKIERFHRFMNDLLAKYTYKNPLDWDSYIPSMLMTYRTSVQESTQFTPFLMIYGRDPVLPIDTLLQPKLRYLGDAYVPTMLQRLHEVHLDAKEHLKHSRERNKERLDEKAVVKQFSPGDAVFYYNRATSPGESTKLKLKWQPFYRIVEQKSPVNYAIKHQKTGKVKIVHVNDLQMADPNNKWDKLWDTHGTYDPKRNPPPEDDDLQPLDPPRRQPVRATRLTAPLADSTRAQPPMPVRQSSRLLAKRRRVSTPPPTETANPSSYDSDEMDTRPLHPLHLKRRPGSPDHWDVVDDKRPRIEDNDDNALDVSLASLSTGEKTPRLEDIPGDDQPSDVSVASPIVYDPPRTPVIGPRPCTSSWYIDFRWRKLQSLFTDVFQPY